MAHSSCTIWPYYSVHQRNDGMGEAKQDFEELHRSFLTAELLRLPTNLFVCHDNELSSKPIITRNSIRLMIHCLLQSMQVNRKEEAIV
jgi:hypothetical protein